MTKLRLIGLKKDNVQPPGIEPGSGYLGKIDVNYGSVSIFHLYPFELFIELFGRNTHLLRAAILYAVTAVRRQETISPELDLGRRLDHTLLKVPIGRQVFYH